MLVLDRVDTVPLSDKSFDSQFSQWLSVLVDTLNEIITDIQNSISSVTLLTDVTQVGEINSIYIPSSALTSPPTSISLPVGAVAGSKLLIAGQSPGGWVLTIDAAQTVYIASTGAIATASIASSNRYDSLELICVLGGVAWIATSTQTTGFVIV